MDKKTERKSARTGTARQEVIVYVWRHEKYDSNKRINGCPIKFISGLTDEGKKHMTQTAMIRAKEIGVSSNRIILMGSSDRPRAIESKGITKNVFVKSGIKVSSEYGSAIAEISKLIVDAELTQKLLDEFGKQREQNPKLTWMEFWQYKSALYLDPSKVETFKGFEGRMNEAIKFVQDFSQRTDLPEGKQVIIVLFSHEEVVKILASLFKITVMEVPNGTGLKLTVNPEEEKMTIEVQGQIKTLTFDELNKMEV